MQSRKSSLQASEAFVCVTPSAFNRRRHRTGHAALDLDATRFLRAPHPVMRSEPLDHEGGGGDQNGDLRRPPADETGQRENCREQQHEDKGCERRLVAGGQAAAQAPRAGRSGLRPPRFRLGPSETTNGPNDFDPSGHHDSSGALASSASACRPSANSAGRRSYTMRCLSTRFRPVNFSETIFTR